MNRSAKNRTVQPVLARGDGRPGPVRGRIFIISGPSGSGKTTLHKQLLLSGRLKGILVKSVSATTRGKRPGERQGQDYLFFTKEKFLQKIASGYFLEWQKVFESYYGTPCAAVEKLLVKGVSVLLCIDVKGAKVVFRAHPGAVGIFIKAPSLAVLKARLKNRGSETGQDLKLRLRIAKEELKEAKHYDHIVVNNHFKKTAKQLERIVLKELKGRV